MQLHARLASICAGSRNQGVGLGDDEFSPVTVPSLKHLWTNLKTQKIDEADGYTLHLDANDERQRFEVPKTGHGYSHEIVECMRCIQNDQIESEHWSHQNSLEMIRMMDEITLGFACA